MSAMRGLGVLGLIVVAAALAFFMFDGDAEEPVAAGQTTSNDVASERAEAPAVAPPAADTTDVSPTRTEARAESTPDLTGDPATAAAHEGHRIVGRVVDEGGRPVAGADIRLLPRGLSVIMDSNHEHAPAALRSIETVTAADGRFAFEDVAGSIAREVFVRSRNLVDLTHDVPTTEGDVDLGDLVATLGGTLTGHVVDDAGNPVPGAEVRAWTRDASTRLGGMLVLGDIGGTNARTATTDGGGFFRIDGLKPGAVTALASAEGYTRQSVKGIDLKRGEVTANVKIPVSSGFGIDGIVLDDGGRPLADAEIWVSETVIDLSEGRLSGALSKGRKEATDQTGRFRLTGLRDGSYNLTARKRGYLTRVAAAIDVGSTDVRISLPTSGVLWGYVTDAESAEPVAEFAINQRGPGRFELGALVTPGTRSVLRGAEAATAAGVEEHPSLYAITSLAAEKVDVDVNAEGYTRFGRAGVDVPSGQRIRLDISLTPELTLSGIVYDAAGQPAANATVSVAEQQEDGGFQLGGGMRFSRRVAINDDGGGPEIIEEGADKRATTDTEGRFVVKGLGPGDYSVVANHREWAPSEAAPIMLGEQSVSDLEVVLRAGGRLTGTAFDAEGLVLSGGMVRLKKSAGGMRLPGGMRVGGGPSHGPMGSGPGGDSLSAETGPDGKYEIVGILPGRYVAELTSPRKSGGFGAMIMFEGMGGPEKGTAVTIEEGETASLDLALAPTGTLRGRVTEAGNPVSGVPVSLSKSDAMIPGFGGPSARTDDEGRFELADIEPGTYKMSATPKGGARPITRTVEIDARRVTQEDVNLPSGGITGRVTDTDSGDGIEGVVIEVTPADRDDEPEAPVTRRAAFVAIQTSDSGPGGVQSFTFGNEDEVVMTDSDGNYEVRYLDPADYEVAIRGGGVEAQSKDRVRVHPGGITDGVDFEATRGATLIVRARTSDDEPLHFLRATLTNEQTGEADSQMEVGSPSITFEGLAPGSYQLSVSSGNSEGERAVTISSGEEKEITIDLE